MQNGNAREGAPRREYTKRERAVREEETRRRIVEATVALHQSRGGEATITEIARLAGVARVTLYRHFPDELALYTACTSHYQAMHPPPDLEAWAAIEDPVERLRAGLSEAYAFHRETQAMMTISEREMVRNPVLAELLKPLLAYWIVARDLLARDWSIEETRKPLLRATIGLALSFSGWRTLTVEQGLTDAECVALWSGMIERLAGQG